MSHNKQSNADLYDRLANIANDAKDEHLQANIALELSLQIKDDLAELKRQSPEDYEILLEELRDEG